jgi:hypothetical protein
MLIVVLQQVHDSNGGDVGTAIDHRRQRLRKRAGLAITNHGNEWTPIQAAPPNSAAV